jgi:hypothetical protein
MVGRRSQSGQSVAPAKQFSPSCGQIRFAHEKTRRLPAGFSDFNQSAD